MKDVHLEVKLVSIEDAKALSVFYRQNADHLRVWEPHRDDGYHLVDAWTKRLEAREKEQYDGHSAHFIAYNTVEGAVVATCSLTNIVRDPFLACHMGYSVSEEYQGRGLMKGLCLHVIDYAFNELGLNRIMANYMPNNRRSEALLNSLGFRKEGLAKNYLLINGKWEDHVLSSLLNPKNSMQM